MNVNRYYICDSCDYYFMVKQEINEKLKKKCPECGKHKLYQDLTGQHTYVYHEPTTIKHQADRNTKQMGKYQLEEATRKEQIQKDKPKLDQLKKLGLAKESDEVINRKNIINPTGEDLSKKLKPIITESNPKEKAKKVKKYIMEGKV